MQEGMTIKKVVQQYLFFIIAAVVFTIIYSLTVVYATHELEALIEYVNRNQEVNWDGIYGIVASAIFAALALYLSKIFVGYFSTKSTHKIRNVIVNKVLRMSYSESEKKEGIFLTRLLGDINELYNFLNNGLPNLLNNMILIIVIYAYLFMLNWKLVVITGVFYPAIIIAIIIATHYISKHMNQLMTKRKVHSEDYISRVQESYSGIEIERSYNLQDVLDYKINDKIDAIYKLEVKERIWMSYTRTVSFALRMFPVLICCIIIASGTFLSDITNAQFVAYTVLINMIAAPLNDLPNLFVTYKQALINVQRLNDILEMPNERSGEKTDIEGNVPIAFEQVNFSYLEGHPTLKDMTFSVKKGQHIAFVGHSGSGKSTIFNLLLGIYKVPSEGYRFHETPFQEMNLKAARQFFSVVEQDGYIFNASVRENISCLDSNMDTQRIYESAKKAHIHEFIQALPKQYDTILGEDTLFSGGQKQRLILARAFYRDAPIFIFDEPTSALDRETETKIQDSIEQYCEDKTTITITHRLAHIKKMDVIYVLHEGEIVSSGHHDILIENCPYYKSLYENQFALKGVANEPI